MVSGNIIRLFILLYLFSGASFAATESENGAASVPKEEQKRVIEIAIDKLSIELARYYVTQKRTKFPAQVTTIAGLEAYLSRLYPSEGHELRIAVMNLRRHEEAFDSYEGTVKVFLKNGLKMYAVNLDGRPLGYDLGRVEAIINEAVSQTDQLKPGIAERSPGRNGGGKPSGAFGSALNFIKQNSLIVLGALVAVNLALLYQMLARRAGKRHELKILQFANSYQVPENSVKVFMVEDRGVVKKETRITDEQAPEERSETVAALPVPEIEEGKPVASSENGMRPAQWLIVRTSIPGKLHVDSQPPIPCQDSNYYEEIGEGCGIAVVCDGAGSKEHSHYGSRFVTQKAASYFREIVEQNNWQTSGILPTQAQWHDVAKIAFARIRANLEEYAKELGFDSSSLSCTVIVVIHSPEAILATHVGDGRAAFCNAEGEWKALIKPHKGEEANNTFFITSIDWNEPDKYIESTIYEEKPFAFTLLSDGCESHSFEVNIYDEQEQKYKDPNRPYPKFFQPLVATLRSLHQSRARREEIDAKWERFIRDGSEKLKNEPDDKTMVLGILLD
jgi:hypothetical protein